MLVGVLVDVVSVIAATEKERLLELESARMKTLHTRSFVQPSCKVCRAVVDFQP